MTTPGPARRHPQALTALAIGASGLALLLAAGSGAAWGGQAPFRSAVDLIAVDVQVVDKEGTPVGPLGPESFDVSINKQPRKILSAQFIRHAWPGRPDEGLPVGAPPDGEPTLPGGGRTFILAIDNASFDIGEAREVIEAVQAFVQQLDVRDRVGVYVYPTGFWMPPTAERASVRARLGRVIGEKGPMRSHFNLTPAEIVDITAQSTNPNSFLTARGRSAFSDAATAEEMDPVRRVQRRECPGDPDCLSRIYAEGMELAVRLESQTLASLSGLQVLLQQLTEIPGRKAVVLVSAGVLVSDRPDGRPDIGDQARMLGQTAARANATVYALHIDSTGTSSGSASRRGAGSSERARERAMFGLFLDQFSSAAGGSRLYVPVGGGGFALTRILRESSGYYLLGVQPEDADRDGKPRALRVRVKVRGVTVRSRQWVLVPARER